MAGVRKRRASPDFDKVIKLMLEDESQDDAERAREQQGGPVDEPGAARGHAPGLSAFKVAELMVRYRLRLSRVSRTLSRLFPRQSDSTAGLQPMGVLGLSKRSAGSEHDAAFVSWMAELRRVLRELKHGELID